MNINIIFIFVKKIDYFIFSVKIKFIKSLIIKKGYSNKIKKDYFI
jgi:hypothetical protein